MLVAISSAVAELHGKDAANRLVRCGFAPLIASIAAELSRAPAADRRRDVSARQEAFPIILGQSWRMMAAGIVAYGVSVPLNIWIFSS